jgi:hypothetical protein
LVDFPGKNVIGKLDIYFETTESSLQEIFDYLKPSDKRCCIAINEFQQITEYPEKGMNSRNLN